MTITINLLIFLQFEDKKIHPKIEWILIFMADPSAAV